MVHTGDVTHTIEYAPLFLACSYQKKKKQCQPLHTKGMVPVYISRLWGKKEQVDEKKLLTRPLLRVLGAIKDLNQLGNNLPSDVGLRLRHLLGRRGVDPDVDADRISPRPGDGDVGKGKVYALFLAAGAAGRRGAAAAATVGPRRQLRGAGRDRRVALQAGALGGVKDAVQGPVLARDVLEGVVAVVVEQHAHALDRVRPRAVVPDPDHHRRKRRARKGARDGLNRELSNDFFPRHYS